MSVALCTYDGSAYVREQVGSILAQSRPVTELVIADDGSGDGTPAIVDEVLAAHAQAHPDAMPRVVRLAGGSRLGVAANFQRALLACTGDLIALSDQDDVWHPDRIERLVAEFASVPAAGLVHSNARLVDAEGAPLGATLFEALGLTAAEHAEIDEGRGFEALLRRNLATGATTILRSGVRDLALPIPDGWLHDEWLAIVAAATSRTAIIDAALTDYRQHGANVIGVSAPTLRDKLGRLRQPRTDRNARLLRRARSLVERLSAIDGVPPDRLELARRKLAHEETRSALPEVALFRVPLVLAAAVRGSYRRFGNGSQDVLRDLVQPV